jgi:hypothetical protein
MAVTLSDQDVIKMISSLTNWADGAPMISWAR